MCNIRLLNKIHVFVNVYGIIVEIIINIKLRFLGFSILFRKLNIQFPKSLIMFCKNGK